MSGQTRSSLAAPSGRCAGFTLLEVLLAMLLLSFGVLGFVSLQLSALQAVHSAYQHSLASVLAADVAERLWMGLAEGQIDTGWLPAWEERRRCGSASDHVCLPELEVSLEEAGAAHAINLSWAETRGHGLSAGRRVLEYRVQLLPERPS
ncbi:type IV pilus modification protein PilV [Thioalkalivibrio sp.]|uniref:type IV pilus modification protein PilV n=1 Tax=Thioalkalivibrio sp. TaxID=2093813 RepID=UPI003974A8E6